MTADPSAAPVCRAALVLGAKVWPGGRPSPALRRRAEHAAGIFRAGDVEVILACGGLGEHPPSEARLIMEICADAGVPPQAIILEDQSTTTLENIRNAARILATLDIDTAVIVTNDYHAPRARLTARRFGLRASSSSPTNSGVSRRTLWLGRLREVPAYIYYALRPWPSA